jgi:hypothetical protein
MRDNAGIAVLFSCIFRSARKLSIKSALGEELHNRGSSIKRWPRTALEARLIAAFARLEVTPKIDQ